MGFRSFFAKPVARRIIAGIEKQHQQPNEIQQNVFQNLNPIYKRFSKGCTYQRL